MPGTDPLQPEAVVARLRSLRVPVSMLGAAVLHLLTPTRSVVGIHVNIDNGVWSWRGMRRVVPHATDIHTLSHEAASFVHEGWHAADRAVDLNGNCLKPIRSGAYVLVGGAFLYGGPEILVSPDINDPAGVASAWLSERVHHSEMSGVIVIDGITYLVQGDDRVVRISSTDGSCTIPETGDTVDVDGVAKYIADSLGVHELDAAAIGSRAPHTTDVDYVGTFIDTGISYDVIIPSTIGTAMSIGAPHGAAIPKVSDWYGVQRSDAWYGVSGYEPIEPAVLEPGWVARHNESGLYVLIRPSVA